MYLSELSFVLTFIFTFKRCVYIEKILYSRNMKIHLKKKEILRKGPASLHKISLWDSFQFMLAQIKHLVSL